MGEWNYDKILTEEQKEHLKNVVRNEPKSDGVDYCSCGSKIKFGRNHVYHSEKYKDAFTCMKCLQERFDVIRDDYVKEYIKSKIGKYIASKKTRTGIDLDFNYLVGMLMLTGPICPYLLCEIDITTAWKLHLDRFDNEGIYEKGNIVWCSQRANRLKSDMTIEELKTYNPVFYERGLEYLKHIKENI